MNGLYLEYYARSIGILSKLAYIFWTKTGGMHKRGEKQKDYRKIQNAYMNEKYVYMYKKRVYCGSIRNGRYII